MAAEDDDPQKNMIAYTMEDPGTVGIRTMSVKCDWLEGVDYYPDPERREALAQYVAGMLVRTGACNTLPIYVINAHSGFEPKLELVAPEGMPPEDEAYEREFRSGDMVEAGFSIRQASPDKRREVGEEMRDLFILGRPPGALRAKHTGKGRDKGWATKKRWAEHLSDDHHHPTPPAELQKRPLADLKDMSLIPSFVVTTTPPGMDASCGDAGAQTWLSDPDGANTDRIRSCLLSDKFNNFLSFDSTLSNMFVPPGYPCINKMYQFHEQYTTGGRHREKWGVMKLSTVPDEKRRQIAGLLEMYDHTGTVRQLDSQRMDQLLAPEFRGDSSPAMDDVWKKITKSAENVHEVPLSYIVETLGPGIYIDMSCSGTMMKIWDPKPPSMIRDLSEELARVHKAAAAEGFQLGMFPGNAGRMWKQDDEGDVDPSTFTVDIDTPIARRWRDSLEEVEGVNDPLKGWEDYLVRHGTGRIQGAGYAKTLMNDRMARIATEVAKGNDPKRIGKANFTVADPDMAASGNKSYLHTGAVYRAIQTDVEKLVHAARVGWELMVNKLKELDWKTDSGCDINCTDGFGEASLPIKRLHPTAMEPEHLGKLHDEEETRLTLGLPQGRYSVQEDEPDVEQTPPTAENYIGIIRHLGRPEEKGEHPKTLRARQKTAARMLASMPRTEPGDRTMGGARRTKRRKKKQKRTRKHRRNKRRKTRARRRS